GVPLMPISATLASSDIHLRYNTIEGLFGQKLLGCGPLEFIFQAGIQYSRINFDEKVTYTFQSLANTNVSFHNRVWGVGPELALMGSFCFGNALFFPGFWSIAGRASTALLASNSHSKFTETTTLFPSIQVNDEPTWRIIPAFHLR